MVQTISLIVLAVVSLGVGSAVFAKEARLRWRQKRWADLMITSLMLVLVSLLVLAALQALLVSTGALDAIERAIA